MVTCGSWNLSFKMHLSTENWHYKPKRSNPKWTFPLETRDSKLLATSPRAPPFPSAAERKSCWSHRKLRMPLGGVPEVALSVLRAGRWVRGRSSQRGWFLRWAEQSPCLPPRSAPGSSPKGRPGPGCADAPPARACREGGTGDRVQPSSHSGILPVPSVRVEQGLKC